MTTTSSKSELEIQSLTEILNSIFHHTSFRPKQLGIIQDIMGGLDTLALLPTGSGKSLCYQLPAVASGGLTIVISPLLALIDDQQRILKNLGIPVGVLNSAISTKDRLNLFKDLDQDQPECRILYTTPETLMNEFNPLRQKLIKLHENQRVNRVVIDEAHCVSNWGHNFREDYLRLRDLKTIFPQIQIVAFTATATPLVQLDIIRQLGLDSPQIHVESYIRHNLSYQIRPKVKPLKNMPRVILELIRDKYQGQSGIIYCFRRETCEDLASFLKDGGLSAEYFHAGLDNYWKKDTLDRWLTGEISVIVATIAFGLGINKPDVRYVIHYDLPKSLESYYQETGRAGRDGQPSDCILFYSEVDNNKLRYIIKGSKVADSIMTTITMLSGGSPRNDLDMLEDMANYCQNTLDCRKRQMSLYLGEYQPFTCLDVSSNENFHENPCDNCRQHRHHHIYDFQEHHHLDDLNTLLSGQSRFDRDELKIRLQRILPFDQDLHFYRVIDQLLVQGHLHHHYALKSEISDPHEIENFYVPTQPVTHLVLDMPPERDLHEYFTIKRPKAKMPSETLQILKDFRRKLGSGSKVPRLSDQLLENLSRKPPQNLMELFQTDGVTTDIMTVCGDALLKLLKKS